MKKFRYIFLLFGVIATVVLGVSLSKKLIPNAVSVTAALASQTQSLLSTIAETETTETTKKHTTIIHTTLPVTTKPVTTVKPTEKQTTTTAVSSTKETTQSEEPPFPIQIPTLKLPDLLAPTTQLPTLPSGEPDLKCFDNCAFIGNSRFISFKNYGLAKNVYSVVGLNVDTVFTKSCSGSNVTVINELNGKDFDKIILMFGDNECGWPNKNIFIERYSKVIAAVKERNPDAEIYLHGILPVSAEASAESNFGCNNETINSLNQKIKQLAADEGVNYIEPPAFLFDSNGALIANAASDGIHLNKKYSEIWLQSLAETIY